MHSVEMQKSVSVQVDSDFALLLPSGVYEIKKMEPRSKLRKVILFCLLLSLFGMVAFGYFCPDQVCALSARERVSESLALSYAEAPGRPLPDVIAQPGLSYDEVLHDDFRFDLNAHDVMVFLHIQKTGGTSFGKHLVMDLDLKSLVNDLIDDSDDEEFIEALVSSDDDDEIAVAIAIMRSAKVRGQLHCIPRIKYYVERTVANYSREVFKSHFRLFPETMEFVLGIIGPTIGNSEYSRGRKPIDAKKQILLTLWVMATPDSYRCGLHADFTELTACVGGELDRHEGSAVHRRYFYITLLREPVSRYLSEYRHVKRGATWKGSRHWCQGRTATGAEVPACYTGDSWRGVTLEEFMTCPWNLANNRQTRMLADLALVGCYNGTLKHRTAETDRVLLASAKRNLAAMAYFGLTEFQKISQYVFEETFNLLFAVPFTQHNATVSGATLSALSPAQIAHIKRLNSLDLELYEFAKNLMFKRFEALKKRDTDFEYRWRHLGEVARSGVTEFDWDSNMEDATTEKAKGK